ncbi:tetratricopeptide repeat protein [Flavobacterium sp. WV_118_3]|uniref:tetratricopeptide repeat protein n=1 Tax=Flavobacterium sp. WV_118_3 TaxID=3151764 RepID=UPI0032196FEF
MRRFVYIILLLPFVVWAQGNLEKGIQLFDQARYDDAKPYFTTVLKENPENARAMEYTGDIAAHKKEWDEAISCYQKLTVQYPKNAGYYYKYGGAMAMKAKSVSRFKAFGMIDPIEKAFLTAVRLDPKQVESRWALVIFYLELPGILGGSEKKAQRYSDELMVISPVDGYLSKGHIAEYFKRYPEAEKYFIKAVSIGQSKVTYQRLADLYKNKMKMPEKAKQTLDLYQKKKT